MKNWFDTVTGRRVYLLEPDPEQIDINDIAWSLSNICRYNGHCDSFFSVAQHSVEVSLVVPWKWALEALLHDASEAYLGDVISPLKNLLPGYRDLENLWADAINQRFGIESTSESSSAIKTADLRLLLTERRDITKLAWSGVSDWPEDSIGEGPYEHKIDPRDPEFSRGLFMHTFKLFGK
jgi:hypothetical protein